MATEYTNVIFVDSVVSDSDVFVSSVNTDTFAVTYTQDTTRSEILDLLKSKFTSIKNIAVISYTSSLFLDSEPFFSDTVSDSVSTLNPNTLFMIDIIQQFNVENIHFLACNSLNEPNWVSYFNILKSNTSVVVGASNDYTGNMKYGGNWEMENISTNIEPIYFSSNIESYKYLLDAVGISYFVVNGNLYACGENNEGQLGIGTNNNTTMFSRVTLPTGKIASKFTTGETKHSILI